jgi:hypothetical protein
MVIPVSCAVWPSGEARKTLIWQEALVPSVYKKFVNVLESRLQLHLELPQL